MALSLVQVVGMAGTSRESSSDKAAATHRQFALSRTASTSTPAATFRSKSTSLRTWGRLAVAPAGDAPAELGATGTGSSEEPTVRNPPARQLSNTTSVLYFLLWYGKVGK